MLRGLEHLTYEGRLRELTLYKRFSLDEVLKKFFTWRMVVHWNRLPREAADASSLEVKG